MPERLRILLMTRPFSGRFVATIRQLLLSQFDCHEVYFQRSPRKVQLRYLDRIVPPDQIGRLAIELGVDAAVIFTTSSDVHNVPRLNWKTFDAPRVWWDEDFWRDDPVVGLAPTNPGSWREAFVQHDLTLALAMGRETTERLQSKGVRAKWLPKAADTTHFASYETDKSGILMYGRNYPTRQFVAAKLRECEVEVGRIGPTPYDDLPSKLRSAAGSLVISSSLRLSWPLSLLPAVGPRVSNKILRLMGSSTVGRSLGGSVEPMIKLFESASIGALPIVEYSTELRELGFVHGSTAMVVSSMEQLVDVCKELLLRPEDFCEMQSASARLARDRHDWRHRISSLEDLIRLEIAHGI